MTLNTHALFQKQVDGVADYISNFIKNVLSENEVRLNESGMLHISRLPLCTKNSQGVTYFHPLPSASVTSAEIAANSLTPLGLALAALKFAHNMVPKVGAYKKRCVSLVDRCTQLMVNVCLRVEVDSPILPPSDLEVLMKYAVNFMFTSWPLADVDHPAHQYLHCCSRYHNQALG